MAILRHTVIQASAGSGKTFQLSNRYLELLLEGESVDRILATTFTRKAAGEILDRILTRLGHAALSEKAAVKLVEEIWPGQQKTVSQQEIADLLAKFVFQLNRVRVGTLDSFFIKLAQSFSFEIDLPPGWSIAEDLDREEMITEAVKKTMEQLGTKTAINLMFLLCKYEVPVDISRNLISLANQLIDIDKEADASAWDTLKHSPLSPNDLQLFMERLLKAEVPPTKKGDPDGRFLKAVRGLVQYAKDSNWDQYLKSSMVQTTLYGYPNYYSVDFSGYTDLVQGILGIVECVKSQLVNPIVDQTKATCEILNHIGKYLRENKRETGRYTFDDITTQLSGGNTSFRPEQIVYRIDTETRHLLLDEFQDTSLRQWTVLKPFIDSILISDPRRSFFCVGDIKQAIYGWRGGLASLFEMVGTMPLVQNTPLNDNWRSSPVILETVNEIFLSLKKNDVLCPIDKPATPNDLRTAFAVQNAAENWSNRFVSHRAAPKNKSFDGYCTFEVAPCYSPDGNGYVSPWLPNGSIPETDDDSSSDDSEIVTDPSFDPSDNTSSQSLQNKLTLTYAVDRIIELHRQLPGATIGVLVRKNKTAGSIIAGLQSLGIEASGEGGSLLTDAASVETILAILALTDHPGNSIALFRVAHTPPLADFFSLSEMNPNDDSAGKRISFWLRDQIATHSFGSVVEQLAELVKPMCDSRECERLQHLVNMAAFYTNPVDRIDRFIDTVRKTKIESPTSDRIRVMTINKSKGLEFDIVVLPELNANLFGYTLPVDIRRDRVTWKIDAVFRHIDTNRQALFPQFVRDIIDDNKTFAMEEALCLLYVAMTRAIHQLVMIVKPEKGGTVQSYNYSNILWAGFRCAYPPKIKKEKPIPNEMLMPQTLYQKGNPEWWKSRPELQQAPAKRYAVSDTVNTSPFPFRSERKIDFSRSPEMPIVWKKRPDFRHGLSLHRCFEEVRWLDLNGMPDDFVLRKALGPILFFPNDIEKTITHFHRICHHGKISNELRLESYRKRTLELFPNADLSEFHWTVETERSYISQVEGRYRRNVIDRLVVFWKGNHAVAADIIDFKTDWIEDRNSFSEDMLIRFDSYFAQVDRYAEWVGKCYALPKEKVARRLFLVSADLILATNPHQVQ